MKSLASILGLLLIAILMGCSSVKTTEGNGTNNTNGIVKLNLPDRSVYEGTMKDGLFDGKGIIHYGNGDSYEGDFKEGIRDGTGTLSTADGNKIEGEFKDGKYNGTGIFIAKNGERYEGSYSNGWREGRGTLLDAIGDKYEGEFKNGRFNGKGVFFCTNGERYDGEFKNGLFDGTGTFFRLNGGKDAGEFHNGVLNGKGTRLTANGNRYEGEYTHGSIVKGVACYANGDKYEGNFKDGRSDGSGIFITAGGHQSTGEFKAGKFLGKKWDLIVADCIMIIGSLILIFRCVFCRHGLAQSWAYRAFFTGALCILASGLMGLTHHWYDFGISKPTLTAIERIEPAIGGIAIGIFIALLFSGQFLKIGKRPAKAVADIESKKEAA